MPSSSPKPNEELRRARPLLGTLVEIRAWGLDPTRLNTAINRAFKAVERVQSLMSFHDKASDVSRLNREAAQRPIRVHAWTRTVLRRACRLHADTGGLFDIASAPALVGGGWLPRVTRESGQSGHADDISFFAEGRIRFRQPLLIDLGGIAKGFAVDRAVAALRRSGVPAGVVNAGGDLRVFGPHPEIVHARSPESPGILEPLVMLREGAVATSAHYFAERLVNGRLCSPIFDPREKRLRSDRISISVQAGECWLADALCKVVWLAGADALPLLQAYGARAWVREAGSGCARRKEFRHAA
jgi:FAD:protein FMN transferase